MNEVAVTQTLTATDTASSAGLGDGVTLCGARSYSISPTIYPFLSLNMATMTLVSTDTADITLSPVTITVTSTLDDYPSVPPVTASFSVEILDPCLSTVLNFDPAVNDMVATLNEGIVT